MEPEAEEEEGESELCRSLEVFNQEDREFRPAGRGEREKGRGREKRGGRERVAQELGYNFLILLQAVCKWTVSCPDLYSPTAEERSGDNRTCCSALCRGCLVCGMTNQSEAR